MYSTGSPYMIVKDDRKVGISQKAFLSNDLNKHQLTALLLIASEKADHTVHKNLGDVDTLIVSTVLDIVYKIKTAVVLHGVDSDLLIMLLYWNKEM